MTTRNLAVPLKGFGTATEAQVVIEILALQSRFARGAAAVAAGLALALIALPIPLVHLVLVPGAALLGIGLGALRVGQREVFLLVEGTCPLLWNPSAARFGGAGVSAAADGVLQPTANESWIWEERGDLL